MLTLSLMAWPSLTTRSFLSSLLFCFISPTILISFSNKKNPIIVTLATKPSHTALHGNAMQNFSEHNLVLAMLARYESDRVWTYR